MLEWLKNVRVDEINLVNTYDAVGAEYPMKNVGRKHCGVLYTIEGEEIYSFADKEICTSPNTVLFIPKNERYSISLKSERSVVIAIDFEAEGYEDLRPFLTKVGPNTPMRSIFCDAERSWIKKSPEYYVQCLCYLYKIFASLIRAQSEYLNTESYLKIADAVNYLHSHYLDPTFRIDHLLSKANMSLRYFEVLFVKQFKMTPKEYVIHLKLELAKELLQSEKYTATTIASKLGFSDVYHFSRIFKLKTGYSPTQYKLCVQCEK